MRITFTHIFLSVALFPLLIACHSEQIENKYLLYADSLLQVRPDSALLFLKQIPASELTTPKEQAEFALLLTQAKDDNHITHTNDSLIKTAIAYYQHTGSKARKQQAFFYLGSVYRDMEQSTSAVAAFQEALNLSSKKEDRLTALTYNNLSSLYQEQGFYEKAIELARQAYTISRKLNNRHDMAYFLRNLGLASRFDNQPDSALAHYKEALECIQNTEDRKMESFILSDIAHVYEQMGELDLAYQYMIKSMEIAPNKEILASMFFVTGKVFHRIGEMDSARNYLTLSLDNGNIHTRAATRLELSAIEEKSGNLRKAFEYNREYLSLKDSIDTHNKRKETAILINEYEIKTAAERIASFTLKRTSIIILAVGILALLSIHLFRKYRKKHLLQKQLSSADPVQALSVVLNTQDRKFQSLLATFQADPAYSIVEKVQKNDKQDIHLPAEERETIRENILNIFGEVSASLKQHYPKLTSDEVYCCLLYLAGCTSPDIKAILCIESGALRVKRTRIRKKIDPVIYDLIFASK